MLRQQMEKENPDDAYMCQSDFVAPKESGVEDYMGMFAVACFGCDKMVAKYEAENDDYSKIMAQALADRLAEAFAEAVHREIRADIWGYSEHEKGEFDAAELHKLNYQGIRPAPGYPSQPDHTEKRTMWDLMQVEAKVGIELSDSLAMMPASAVSALVFGHSKSSYFGVGNVNKDQIVDYTARKVRMLPTPCEWSLLRCALSVGSNKHCCLAVCVVPLRVWSKPWLRNGCSQILRTTLATCKAVMYNIRPCSLNGSLCFL